MSNSFLDKLQSLINIKLDLSKLKEIHLFSDNKREEKSLTIHTTVNINVGTLSQKDKKELSRTIKEEFEEGSTIPLLIEEESKKLLESFREIDRQKSSKEEIEYFRGKIPSQDLDILRASIFIKSKSEKESIGNLKQDLIRKYGDRGKNIPNLYSAGYFEKQVKPLCEDLTKGNISTDKFKQIYERIVTEMPQALFINRNMTDEEVKEEIQKKFELCKKYGIRFFNIHGIGRDNIEKISTAIKNLTKDFPRIPEVTYGERIIAVRIWVDPVIPQKHK